MDLPSLFGHIDIYLFDQILRGNIRPGMRVVDAGCGAGRNLVYLLREGYEVCAADSDGTAIARVQAMAAELAPRLPASNFRVEPVEAMTFDDACGDLVISSAVLHFARSDEHFMAMLGETWRVVAPGGLLFCRLASTIGMADRMRPIGGNRYLLPDGTERYLVDEETLMRLTKELAGSLADPLKTTIVQDQRCMTTWVVRKR
ncbi:MAG: class I SAM-dependent methyltransferase [Bacteroidales bacterium]